MLLSRCLTTATRGAAGECRGREAGQRPREERLPPASSVEREDDEMKGRDGKRDGDGRGDTETRTLLEREGKRRQW